MKRFNKDFDLRKIYIEKWIYEVNNVHIILKKIPFSDTILLEKGKKIERFRESDCTSYLLRYCLDPVKDKNL